MSKCKITRAILQVFKVRGHFLFDDNFIGEFNQVSNFRQISMCKY